MMTAAGPSDVFSALGPIPLVGITNADKNRVINNLLKLSEICLLAIGLRPMLRISCHTRRLC